MLWAVKIRAAEESLDQMYPVESEQAGRESADRLNAWVADVTERHPDVSLDISAELIRWPRTAGAHITGLAAIQAMDPGDEE